MPAFGTSRHFAALLNFGRYRGIAASGKPSARQIYAVNAQSALIRDRGRP
jgi:hypothetical protein